MSVMTIFTARDADMWPSRMVITSTTFTMDVGTQCTTITTTSTDADGNRSLVQHPIQDIPVAGARAVRGTYSFDEQPAPVVSSKQ
jgi:hypothetical protein